MRMWSNETRFAYPESLIWYLVDFTICRFVSQTHISDYLNKSMD
jgi:hypothetical protein